MARANEGADFADFRFRWPALFAHPDLVARIKASNLLKVAWKFS